MREPRNNGYFPLAEYEDRIARLRTEMKAGGMDALLLSTEPNVVYGTGLLDGYWVCTMHDDAQLALVPADSAGEPVLLLADSLEQTAWTSCISDIRVCSQFTAGKSKGSIATVADTFKRGDTVYLDGGLVYQGYPTDIIRCGVIGKPTKDQERYYYASRDANMAALEFVKPGIQSKDIYNFWAETVCKLGFEHSLKSQRDADWDFIGHGLGLGTHELPLLNSTSEEPIVAGMVMAIEGNVFDTFPFRDTKIALKNEENVLVTEDGYEWLTPLANDLWVVEK